MVIGREFIWLHMGKTGGDSTKQMFDNLNGILYSDPRHDPSKHSGMKRTDIDTTLLQDKKIICNIRRLPSWTKSFKQQRLLTHKELLTIDQLCVAAENHILGSIT